MAAYGGGFGVYCQRMLAFLLLTPNGWMDQDGTWYGGIGVSPGDFVLDGDPARSPKSGRSPQFWAHVYCGGQTAGWIKMQLGTEVGLGPGEIVLDGDLVLPPKKGTAPNF